MTRFAPFLFVGALAAACATTAFATSLNHQTHLTGAEEVPAVVTGAQGEATFKIADDGTSIEYKLNVSNMDGVTAAHIHIGPVGVSGPVVAFLFASAGVDANGRLASGTITTEDLIGPFAGEPVSTLIDAIESGNAYVNVHTDAHTGGEIRGQL